MPRAAPLLAGSLPACCPRPTPVYSVRSPPSRAPRMAFSSATSSPPSPGSPASSGSSSSPAAPGSSAPTPHSAAPASASPPQGFAAFSVPQGPADGGVAPACPSRQPPVHHLGLKGGQAPPSSLPPSSPAISVRLQSSAPPLPPPSAYRRWSRAPSGGLEAGLYCPPAPVQSTFASPFPFYSHSFPACAAPSSPPPPLFGPPPLAPTPQPTNPPSVEAQSCAAAAAAAAAALESISRAEALLASATEAAAVARSIQQAKDKWQRIASQGSGPEVEELRRALLQQAAAAEASAAAEALARAGALGLTKTAPPSRRNLWLLSLSSSLPFIGFGFVDNCVMITAGDVFDTTLCVTLGLTTMTAAALGNWISDLMGLWLGCRIEELSARILPLPKPDFTKEQLESPICRKYYYIGTGIGISIGCILGMAPLLFLDTKEGERRKQQREQARVLHSEVASCLKNYLQAEHVVLYLLDAQDSTFDAVVDGQSVCVPSHVGIPGVVFETGQLINWEGAHVKKRSTEEGASWALPAKGKQPSLSALSSLFFASSSKSAEKTEPPTSPPAPDPRLEPNDRAGDETLGGWRDSWTSPLLSALSPRKSVVTEEAAGTRERRGQPERGGEARSSAEERRSAEGGEERVQRTEKKEKTGGGDEAPEGVPSSGPLPGVHTLPGTPDVRHVLAAPIFGIEGNIIGVVEVINPVGRPRFTDQDRDFLLSICPHIAVQLEGRQHLTKIIELCRKQVASREKTPSPPESGDSEGSKWLESHTQMSPY
ncbi:hypothetical protein BESB_036730 [Besnoitia besnoiti]|uniref:GAF domain-containing protein n=1 Tax=Besnoitia besnoiti TaxID=94643 RepID=A0A2A9MGW7_BESBE|nr:hypothetical protein BESB_036730 [Besnoitia besnoiti]PFH37215.1 hypothetical protein BESB_036730 [Besnoitia besnoiti]